MLREARIGYRNDKPVQIADVIHFHGFANGNRARRWIAIYEIDVALISYVGKHSPEERDGGEERSVWRRHHDIAGRASEQRPTRKLESMHELRHAHLNSVGIIETNPTRATVFHERVITPVEEIREPGDAMLGH
jgi:hypothetical protein